MVGCGVRTETWTRVTYTSERSRRAISRSEAVSKNNSQGFLEVAAGLLDRASLTGDIHLRTERYVSVALAFDDRSQLRRDLAAAIRFHLRSLARRVRGR